MLDFDLHVYNITSDELVSVTSDGVRNIVYNGIPDWVYEGWDGGREILLEILEIWHKFMHIVTCSPVYVHVQCTCVTTPSTRGGAVYQLCAVVGSRWKQGAVRQV